MVKEEAVKIPAGGITLDGTLSLPKDACGFVAFAHGSGSSRLSPRNRFVAGVLHREGIGTLLFDLLTVREDEVYENRFNIPLLTDRLKSATRWIREQPEVTGLGLGYFGASTGTAVALESAAEFGKKISAIVSRGGRPDLAMDVLGMVTAPTLLIVGGDDYGVIELNRKAYEALKTEKKLTIVPGATHLFEEPGTLEEAARHAAEWFTTHFKSQPELVYAAPACGGKGG